MPTTQSIPAAGTVPWRIRGGDLEVALVHRPRYDDWSWAKGKLDPGEDLPVAAVRETLEETGLVVRLGRPLPDADYLILDRRDGTFATKQVSYWASTVTGGNGALVNEIDEVAWLSPQEANSRLDYTRDRDQLLALVGMHRRGHLETRPLLIVRHASAVPRGKWSGKDWLRPLDAQGTAQAAGLVDVLAAYGPLRVISSTASRCVDTLAPYARGAGTRLRLRDDLSEEGFEADPAGALKVLRRAVTRGRPAALCTHRPVLPALLESLRELTASADVADLIEDAAENGMAKGEILVVHLAGTGETSGIVAAERHHP